LNYRSKGVAAQAEIKGSRGCGATPQSLGQPRGRQLSGLGDYPELKDKEREDQRANTKEQCVRSYNAEHLMEHFDTPNRYTRPKLGLEAALSPARLSPSVGRKA
jgi:hypothetical protein